MNAEMKCVTRRCFCIFINTFFQGPVPVVSDEEGKFVVFETEVEAQKEIAEHTMIRIQQFLDGERDFDDAITVEEYVLPVVINPEGIITDEAGNRFGPSSKQASGSMS